MIASHLVYEEPEETSRSPSPVTPGRILGVGRLIGVNTVRPLIDSHVNAELNRAQSNTDDDLMHRIFEEMSAPSTRPEPSPNSDVSGIVVNDFAPVNFEAANFSSTEPDINSPILTLLDPSRSFETLLEQRKTEHSQNIENVLDDNTIMKEKQKLTKFFHDFVQKHKDFFKNGGKSTSLDTAKQLQEKYGLPISAELESTVTKLQSELAATRDTSEIQTYKNQSLLILRKYRELSQKLIKAETILKNKVSKFNAIQKQLLFLLTLEENDESRQLIGATEAYLKQYFVNSNLEADYTEFVELHKYWTMLRELLLIQRPPSIENNTAPICCVCLTEPISVAINPCGHTFCAGCRSRFSRGCPICRGHIIGVLKIYFT